MASEGSLGKMKELRLPISRVKTIMKSAPYVETIGQDGLFLVAKATELFIHYLSKEAHEHANKGNALDYKDLAEVAETNETLDFLRPIMPRKITVRHFKQMMAAKNSPNSSSSESSSDSDIDSQSDSESSQDSEDEKMENGNSSGSELENDETKENGKHESSGKSESGCKSDSEDENKG
ncbi:chromatin accessibility complex protein 1 [Cephus cinctus]|uniref:Chromatin accessibility complex protein 1 n=1 Tax=Cephus cinctus TaxID=211228 RepID=A0AAJ7BL24_CEPCN|nr:chromatin accessibility complex protein 1 [Cephus cinctus]